MWKNSIQMKINFINNNKKKIHSGRLDTRHIYLHFSFISYLFPDSTVEQLDCGCNNKLVVVIKAFVHILDIPVVPNYQHFS